MFSFFTKILNKFYYLDIFFGFHFQHDSFQIYSSITGRYLGKCLRINTSRMIVKSYELTKLFAPNTSSQNAGQK